MELSAELERVLVNRQRVLQDPGHTKEEVSRKSVFHRIGNYVCLLFLFALVVAVLRICVCAFYFFLYVSSN